jgi:phosphorylase kinase alpha/beta subunit
MLRRSIGLEFEAGSDLPPIEDTNMHTSDTGLPDEPRRLKLLAEYHEQAQRIILSRQDPISGLLPASTAITVHGDYRHAWVRDNVYSILAVWGLALAYRRQGDDEGRLYPLEQSVVKLMRGLLAAMMKQSAKVEQFKHTCNPLDALHAKYDTRSGEPVVDDDAWGHLQLDATALYLLMLAQMTASGLRIVFTLDEVDFVQNLVHYLGRACYTPDYGIWERGHKMNEGRAEINASSLGMVKAALEALSDFDLFGSHGGPASVIQVSADDIARARNALEALLPRESESKETDAALLSIIGFPAYAVEDAGLVARTRADIVAKLQGRYGCKRFLRDGHQTVLEDHARLHYETGELGRFEHIESEWPLFFTYLLLDGVLRDDSEQARDYRQRLESLLVEQDGQRLLPELYYVPADGVEQEKARPGSQPRLPNDNVPLVWAQSLYLLGVLLQEDLIDADDLDPLGRRLRVGRRRATPIQVAVLAENGTVRNRLQSHGVETETPDTIGQVQVHQASRLAAALGELGRNPALGLSGRPPQRLGSLTTSRVFTLSDGRNCVFLPSFLERRDFYLNLDNHLLVARIGTEFAYLHRNWDQSGQPLLVLMITEAMLEADDHPVLWVLLEKLRSGDVDGVPVSVDRLAVLLPGVGRGRMKPLPEHAFQEPAVPESHPVWLSSDRAQARPLAVATASAWRQEPDNSRLLELLGSSRNPYEQIELLGLLWQRLGPDADTGSGGSVRQLTEAIYARAHRGRLWGVLRRAAGLLGKVDETLADAVADIVSRQHQLSVGHAYSNAAVIDRPMSNAEIMDRIRAYCGDDLREQVLIQEIVLCLGMLIKADPARFRGTLTIRAWHLLLLLTASLARELGITQGEAFDILLEQSPHAILERLRRVVIDAEATYRDLTHVESLHHEGEVFGLKRVRFSAADDPQRTGSEDWAAWREANGILTRLPEDFHPRVWNILRHCQGLIIGDRLDTRNRLDSATVLGDTTPAEKSFALRVEHLLNGIQAPEYRQLCIETLLTLSDIVTVNPHLRVNNDAVLDVLIGTAVRLNWRETHPELAGKAYNEHSAEAWQAFYASPPHRVANTVMAALSELLVLADRELMTAA